MQLQTVRRDLGIGSDESQRDVATPLTKRRDSVAFIDASFVLHSSDEKFGACVALPIQNQRCSVNVGFFNRRCI